MKAFEMNLWCCRESSSGTGGEADAVMGRASSALLLSASYGVLPDTRDFQQMAGNQRKSCRVCDFLYPACLCRLSYSGISYQQAAGAFRQSEAGLPEKGICPCWNCLCDVGLWRCGDFGCDVYPDVPVADRVCTVMPVPASVCPCPEKGRTGSFICCLPLRCFSDS